MTAKLHIDMSQGIISIEGDPELIREICNDFKEQIKTGAFKQASNHIQDQQSTQRSVPPSNSEPKSRVAPRAVAKKKTEGPENPTGINPSSPKLDKNIDTSALAAFYGQYEPKNNSERILIFALFLSENLGIEQPNTDQIYTLFKKTGDRIPKAFAQAFHDTGSKHGYIDFNGPAATLSITIAGHNCYNHDLKKRTVE